MVGKYDAGFRKRIRHSAHSDLYSSALLFEMRKHRPPLSRQLRNRLKSFASCLGLCTSVFTCCRESRPLPRQQPLPLCRPIPFSPFQRPMTRKPVAGTSGRPGLSLPTAIDWHTRLPSFQPANGLPFSILKGRFHCQ